jgi:Family of unknown function (DUF6641)
MSILSKLKLSEATRAKTITDPVVRKREKLLINIERQIKTAEAEIKGEEYTFEDFRYITHAETGKRTRQSVYVRGRRWWWKTTNDVYYLVVKYGARKLEFAKGKFAIEVGAKKNLVPTLKSLAEAVKNGELDTIISSVAKFGAKSK